MPIAARKGKSGDESRAERIEMVTYRINWFRLFFAVAFLTEMGWYFGLDHFHDQSPMEVVASGIAFLLFELAVERKL